MSITLNINIPDLTQLVVYLLIGFVVAIVVGVIGRVRSLVAVLAVTFLAALGGWITVSFVRFQIQPEVAFAKVRLIEAVVGALIFGLGWALFLTRRKLIIK